MKIDKPRVPDNTNLSKAKLPKPPQMPPLACYVHPPFYPNQSIPHGKEQINYLVDGKLLLILFYQVTTLKW